MTVTVTVTVTVSVTVTGLAAFPSQRFYGNALQSQPTPKERPLPVGFAWPSTDVPVAFINIGSQRETAVVQTLVNGNAENASDGRTGGSALNIGANLNVGAKNPQKKKTMDDVLGFERVSKDGKSFGRFLVVGESSEV